MRNSKGQFIKGASTWNKGLKGYNAGAKSHFWKGALQQKTCPRCEGQFPVFLSHISKRKFCSAKCYIRSKQGTYPKWFKGIKVKPNSGNFNSERTRGANNINWKGGVTPLNHKIRTSTQYKEWREAVFKRDDYRCMSCGERNGKLNADHILPFALFPRLRLDINNGRTLCEDCHRQTETYLRNLKQFSLEGRPVIHLTQ